jgi:hypothetical protein
MWRLMVLHVHLFVSHVISHVKTPNRLQQSEGGFSRVSRSQRGQGVISVLRLRTQLPYKFAPPAAPVATRG